MEKKKKENRQTTSDILRKSHGKILRIVFYLFYSLLG